MGLLKEATIDDNASAKVGIFGPNGVGKSLTAFLIALGLSKTFHDGAPIAMHDTEGGSRFLKPIARLEGVKLLVHKSTSFKDMVQVLQEAESSGACVYIQDQASRPWDELQKAYKRKKNRTRLEFQDWAELKEMWREQFVDRYLVSPLHCIVLGRAGNEYDTVEDSETGKKSQERVGSKFKAEGEFGYEPDLLIEMEGRRTPEVETVGRKRRTRKQGGRIVHYAHILKDRGRTLNGVTFEFTDINQYKTGDWKPVYEAFAPHWALLNPGSKDAGTLDVTSSSGELIAGNARPGDLRRDTLATIACEDIQGILVRLWPSQEAVSKKAKAAVLYELFETYSWTAVEHRQVETLQTAVNLLKVFAEQMERRPEPLLDPAQIVGLLQICRTKQADEAAVVAEAEQADLVLTEDGKPVF